MNEVKTWKTLYKLNTQGTIEQWTIKVIRVDMFDLSDEFIVETIFGEYKGKQQIKGYKVKIGKNLGRSNATEAIEQAIAEAQSKFEKKLKSGYVKSLKDAREGKVDKIIKGGISPMLAHKYEDHKNKIKFPAMVQPKLDGQRCIAHYKNGAVTLWTRTRKPILSCPHIVKSLQNILRKSEYNQHELYLDGELYSHIYKDDFEKIMSAVRKQKPSEESLKVQYHIYDFLSNDFVEVLPFKRRNEILWNMPDSFCGNIYFVKTESAESHKELKVFHNVFVNNGYEGLMIRNIDSDYEQKRSINLLKMKTFEDAEFKIIHVEPGKDNTVIFKCITKKGVSFKATMNGDKKSNQKYLSRDGKLKVIGKMLTVEYQGLTGKNGVPRFPQAKRIRVEV